jgi:predicted nucleic acid-binding protein
MRKLKIYVETSVWSQALAEDAPALREASLAFFRAAKEQQLPLFVSEVVFVEFSKATEELSERLRGLVRQFSPNIIPLNDEANHLALEYLQFGIVPASKLDDARHVAVAVVHELDILVSWNYRHLVNLKRREAFHYSSAINGYPKPLQIVTPPEVGYEFQQES